MAATWITHEQAAVVLGSHRSLVAKLVARGLLHPRVAPRRLPSLWGPEVEALAAERRREVMARAERRAERAVVEVRPPDETHDWLSVPQVAQLLGVTRQAVHHRIQKGQLPHVWSSGRRWVRRDLLEQVERAHRAQMTRSP